MDGLLFIDIAIKMVQQFYDEVLEFPDDAELPEELHIYNVWNAKVLKCNKGLFSTNVEDGRYFEVTYNGDKEEFYFDSYKKEYNQAVPILDKTPEPQKEESEDKLLRVGDK